MVCCYDCGMMYKSRIKNYEIQAYDPAKHEWTIKCPNCSYVFNDEDLFEEDYEEDYEILKSIKL